VKMPQSSLYITSLQPSDPTISERPFDRKNRAEALFVFFLFLSLPRESLQASAILGDNVFKGTLTRDILSFFIIFDIKSVYFACMLNIFKFFFCLIIYL
jgi:hypothetical protein